MQASQHLLVMLNKFAEPRLHTAKVYPPLSSYRKQPIVRPPTYLYSTTLA